MEFNFQNLIKVKFPKKANTTKNRTNFLNVKFNFSKEVPKFLDLLIPIEASYNFDSEAKRYKVDQ